MSSLTLIAFEILQSEAMTPGLRQVAACTLLHAIELAIEVPAGTHWAVWRFFVSSNSGSSNLHRHEIPHPVVARDAVCLLVDSDSGEDAQDLALAVLRGANVGEVTSTDLLAIAERALTEGRVRRLGWLVERVHEARGLSPEFIWGLRDRLAASPLPAVRALAVEVGALHDHLDECFTARMFGDEAPIVRCAVADQLDKIGHPDHQRALVLIRERLAVETHRTVVSACHYALGSLIRAGGPRIRQWEPPAVDDH